MLVIVFIYLNLLEFTTSGDWTAHKTKDIKATKVIKLAGKLG